MDGIKKKTCRGTCLFGTCKNGWFKATCYDIQFKVGARIFRSRSVSLAGVPEYKDIKPIRIRVMCGVRGGVGGGV